MADDSPELMRRRHVRPGPEPPQGGRQVQRYTPAEIEARLRQYPGWTLSEDGQLHKEWTFKNFMQVILFVNAIAHLAQVADHHPDLHIHDYKYLAVSLMTHSEKAITDRDFSLIAQIEALPSYT
jgi:4a-hydroxytetrahydrobiopterin dehydratase